MAAHYRHYFRKMFPAAINVYIVNNSKYLELNSDIDQRISTILSVICKYLPTVYFVNKDTDACVTATSNIMAEKSPDQYTFVVSRNVYSYQIPNITGMTSVIRPGRNPKLITSSNAIQLWSKSKTDVSYFNSGLLPLIMAMNKCPELGITTVANFNTACKAIKAAISNNILLNGYNTPNKIYVVKGLIKEEIYNRWLICDLYNNTIEYESLPSTLYDMSTWRIKKHCDFNEISRIIDERINSDPEHILNYIYLVE
jgi:hypothetical protein